ncbi:NAD(P)H-dependent oxidoreductase, partial [Vibrio parahaemolyticus]
MIPVRSGRAGWLFKGLDGQSISLREGKLRILHIDTSILGEYSASRVLSAAVMKNLTAANPDAEVSYLDLAENPLDHLSGAHI